MDSAQTQALEDSHENARHSGQRRPFRGTAENAKTQLCRRFMAGDCQFGDRCNFAHGQHELRSLPARRPGDYSGPASSGPHMGGRMGGRGYNTGYQGRGGYGGGRGRGYSGGQGGYHGGAGYNGGHQGQAGGYTGGQGQQQQRGGSNTTAAASTGKEDYQIPVQGPNGWLMYRVKETSEAYYHNPRTQVTQWDKPPEWV